MIKKGSVHSVGCYWRCHLPQNKCHCLPITQSCRFLLPVNEHSPHVKSPATTYYYNVHCAAAAGGESPPRTFTFVTTDLSCKIFFEKNNTVVITKLNRQNLERSCITYRVKNFYARLWPQLFWVLFFSHQIQPPPPERSASELVPCISLGVWNLVAFSSSSSNSSPSLKWWYQ